MLRIAILAVLGLVIGVIAAQTMGAILGVLIGGGLGALWWMVSKERVEMFEEEDGSVKANVICFPHGQPATCEFVRDPKSGVWTKVKACSHFPPGAEVTCEQRCLRVLNDGTLFGMLRRKKVKRAS